MKNLGLLYNKGARLPLRSELFRRLPELWIPVQNVCRNTDQSVFRNGDSIELYSLLAHPLQTGGSWEETHRLINGHVQVLKLHQCIIGHRSLRHR